METLFGLILASLAQAGPLFEVVQKSATLNEEYFKSLENENPLLFEDDIITSSDGESSALASWSSKWPNGKVPVVFSTSFSNSQKKQITDAMGEIAQKTCVRFKHRTEKDGDYIVILKDASTQCNSNVGKVGGEQQLRLGDECFNDKRTILHELMHAIGFIHEQTRSDRDKYVSINEDNISPDHRHNFEKHKASELTFLNTEYAYDSIMHYSATAFAINPDVPTIVPKSRGVKLGGERNRISDIDVIRINRHYSCGSTNTGQNSVIQADEFQEERLFPKMDDSGHSGTPNCAKLAEMLHKQKTKPPPSKGPAAGFDWHRQDDGITWASDCDFEESNVKNVPSKGEECGSRCAQDAECDHFAWNDYHGGTCWMKKGYNPANARKAGGVVCGFIHTKI